MTACGTCITPSRPTCVRAYRGHSRRKRVQFQAASRWFDEYLSQPPEWKIQHRKAYHVLVDGTWFSENHCLVVYRDADSKSTIYYRFAEDEDEYEIIKDLQTFKTMRVRSNGIQLIAFRDTMEIPCLVVSCSHCCRYKVSVFLSLFFLFYLDLQSH